MPRRRGGAPASGGKDERGSRQVLQGSGATGMPPEGGFAIGSERLLMRLVGAENIRETTLFPRDVNRLTP